MSIAIIFAHSVKKKVKDCPLCREQLKETKNVGLEAVCEVTNFYCPYQSLGCLLIVTGREMEKHRPVCEFQRIECVLKDQGCSFSSSYFLMYKHLLRDHQAERYEFTEKYDHSDTAGQSKQKLLIACNYFFCVSYVTLSSASIHVKISTSKQKILNVKKEFTYQISFGEENKKLIYDVVDFDYIKTVDIPLDVFSARSEKSLTVRIKKNK